MGHKKRTKKTREKLKRKHHGRVRRTIKVQIQGFIQVDNYDKKALFTNWSNNSLKLFEQS